MKKLLSFALTLACIISCFAAPAQAKPEYMLTLNLPIPPIHTRWTNALDKWVKELESRSNGRIGVETFFAEALSPRSEAYESVQSGIADLTESGFEANAGQFLFHENIMSIPTPGRNLLHPMNAVKGIYAQFPQALDEIKGVKLLFCHASPSMMIGTKNRPVRTLADLRGMKINANSAMIAERLKTLGVSVVSMPLSDVYTAMEQGVIDGTTLAFELLVSRRFGDQVKYMTALSVQNTLFYMAMNEDVYNSMPEDLRKVVDDVSGEFADKVFAEYWNSCEYSAIDTWIQKMGGKEMIVLSDADYAEANKLMQGPSDAWFAQFAKKAGISAEDLKKSFYEKETANSVDWKDSELYKHYLSITK